MVAQGGKAGFLKERGDTIAVFLKSGVAVCIPDVRGTGETRPGVSGDRSSSRTSISQTNLILGQAVLGSQLRDLRAVIRWLGSRDGIAGKSIVVWGDSFATVNPKDATLAVPLDAELPAIAEPSGANLAILAGVYEDGVVMVYARGGLADNGSLTAGPYLFIPHDSILPTPLQVGPAARPYVSEYRWVALDATVDAQNRERGGPGNRPAEMAAHLLMKLQRK
jgi:hypothetical protein